VEDLMKVPGYVLAVIGLVLAVLAGIDKFIARIPVITSIQHGNLIAGIIGVVLLVIGAVMAMSGSNASA
jgi:hypothetical protein